MPTAKLQSKVKTPAKFHGGNFWEQIKSDFSDIRRLRKEITPADVLDAWYPPAPSVLSALKIYSELITHIAPPVQSEPLIRSLAKIRKIRSGSICCGTGSSQLIYIVLQHFLSTGDTLLVLDPMFGEYAHVAKELIGCTISRYYERPKDDFCISIPELASHITKIRPRLVVLVNPNSPVGNFLNQSRLQELLDSTPRETNIMIDETYIEYSGAKESCERMAENNPRLMVLKSMSKIYALSGLRVGYLVAHPHNISEIKKQIPPWSVSLPAQIAAVQALQEKKYYVEKIKETRLLRKSMISQLNSIPWVKPFPSVGNYILCQITDSKVSASQVIDWMKQHNIYLRNCDSMSEQFHDDFIRITVMDQVTNTKIIKYLKQFTTQT